MGKTLCFFRLCKFSFYLPKYKKRLKSDFFFIFQAQKVSGFFRVSVSWDIRKVLFLKFLNIKARNLHFPKYKQFFSGWIFFYSLSLDLKSAPGSSILYYWRHPHLCFSFTNFQIFCEQVVFISFLFNFEITL